MTRLWRVRDLAGLSGFEVESLAALLSTSWGLWTIHVSRRHPTSKVPLAASLARPTEQLSGTLDPHVSRWHPTSKVPPHGQQLNPTGRRLRTIHVSRWHAASKVPPTAARAVQSSDEAAVAKRRSAVVIAAGRDPHLIANDLVHQAMLVGDAPRPVAGEVMLQCLGLPRPWSAMARDVPDEGIDAFQDPPVLRLPPQVVLHACSSQTSLTRPRPAGRVPDPRPLPVAPSHPRADGRWSAIARDRRSRARIRVGKRDHDYRLVPRPVMTTSSLIVPRMSPVLPRSAPGSGELIVSWWYFEGRTENCNRSEGPVKASSVDQPLAVRPIHARHEGSGNFEAACSP